MANVLTLAHLIWWGRAVHTIRGTPNKRILLENCFLPGDLQLQIEAFVDHYNNARYHESLKSLTPADVYFGRGQAILEQRERIKQKTIEQRRLQFRKQAA